MAGRWGWSWRRAWPPSNSTPPSSRATSSTATWSWCWSPPRWVTKTMALSSYNNAQCLCFPKININSEVSSHSALWQKQTKQNFFDLNCWVCVVFKWCFTVRLNKCSNWKCRTAAIIKFDVRLIFSTFTPKLGTKNNSSNFLISSGRNKKQKLILWSLLFLFSEKPL